jgi:hypothetical protein
MVAVGAVGCVPARTSEPLPEEPTYASIPIAGSPSDALEIARESLVAAGFVVDSAAGPAHQVVSTWDSSEVSPPVLKTYRDLGGSTKPVRRQQRRTHVYVTCGDVSHRESCYAQLSAQVNFQTEVEGRAVWGEWISEDVAYAYNSEYPRRPRRSFTDDERSKFGRLFELLRQKLPKPDPDAPPPK